MKESCWEKPAQAYALPGRDALRGVGESGSRCMQRCISTEVFATSPDTCRLHGGVNFGQPSCFRCPNKGQMSVQRTLKQEGVGLIESACISAAPLDRDFALCFPEPVSEGLVYGASSSFIGLQRVDRRSTTNNFRRGTSGLLGSA
jgi:hypothetical protein